MMKKTGLTLLTALLAVGTLGGYNASMEVETMKVVSPALPEAFDGFRVALVSDVHGRDFGPGNELLLRRLRSEKPDLIALCGDLVDDREQIPWAEKLCADLCKIAPTYYVSGNHEWGAKCVNALKQALTAAGVRCLSNDFECLTRNGASIVVAGMDDLNGQSDERAREKLTKRIHAVLPNGYILMLSHRNDAPEAWQPYGVQTVLSGHGHGGIIRLPWIGGLVNNERRIPAQNENGLYTAGNTTVVVSRGVGGFRILSRTHLPIVVLKREKVNNS